jgi:iduronate 2-sulfatase
MLLLNSFHTTTTAPQIPQRKGDFRAIRALIFVFLLLTASSPSALIAQTTASPSSPPKLNVLFIMADDLNCNIGAYGHPLVKTPHLDRLAQNGLTFRHAFTNFPVCGQSRASFMTGLYPEQNGVTSLRQLFRDSVPDAITMAQHFRANGYVAARVGKIFHYDNPKGIGTNSHDDPASWDIRVNPRGRDKDEESLIFSLNPGSFGASLSWLAAEGEDEEQTDGKVATESIKALSHFAKTEQPFFLGVGFYKPHTPYVAPRRYFDLYDPAEIEVPRAPSDYLQTLPAPAIKSIRNRKQEIDLAEDTARQAIHAYYATISFMDAQVGRVLAALDELGLRENTVVLFSSDHGYHMGEHGYYQKQTLFEDADRVPLIVSAPGMIARGRQTEALVEMIDFYRSLSELAGTSPVPAYVQGRSFAALLDDPSIPGRAHAFTQISGGYTLRTNRFRYTRWVRETDNNIELYDRLNDPAEMVNLATDPNYADTRTELSALLDRRIATDTKPVKGLKFIPPQPDAPGYTLSDMLLKDPSSPAQAEFPRP